MVKEAGHYNGKITDYGVKTAKTGNPYIEVWFGIDGAGDVKWRGNMTEKTIERTLKTLADMGLKGDLDKIADGPIGKALDQSIVFDLDVELKPDPKDPKKFWPEVRWVNLPRAAKFDRALATQAKGQLSQFAGNWAKVKADLGIKKSNDVGF